MEACENLRSLTLEDIASWSLPGDASLGKCEVHAALPALQRGSVWKPSQVERLWDSLVRGLPIGAFLLSEFSADLGTRPLRGSKVQRDPTHHLIDGQQRALAIGLGFLDIWRGEDPEPDRHALWVDLAPPKLSDDREFLFRVITLSHPWGYKKAAPEERLSAEHCRQAMNYYEHACPKDLRQQITFRAGKIRLRLCWPHDAEAPVPVRLLLEAVRTSDAREALRQSVSKLSIWRDETKRKFIEKRLDGNFFDHLVGGCQYALDASSRIPGIVLPRTQFLQNTARSGDDGEGGVVESLFARINSGGTVLTGEELSYSILKAVWPGCYKLVEDLGRNRMPPSRLVALATRLVLSMPDADYPPAVPDVARFRRLVHGRDPAHRGFKHDLAHFMEKRAPDLFERADRLLTLKPDNGRSFCLPPMLSAELASSAKSSHIYFLLLCWLNEHFDNWTEPGEEEHRRLLGAVTLLSWFASDHKACLDALWRHRRSFFKNTWIRSECFPLRGDNQKFRLVPMMPPRVLTNCLGHVVTKARGLKTYGSDFWNGWDWYYHLSGDLGHNDDDPRRWYAHSENTPFGKGVEDRRVRQEEAWNIFIDKLSEKRQLLYYAQRSWIVKWFPDFDPASLDGLEDTNSPWDIDHIHARRYIENRWSIPQVLKVWHGTIGNLRVWPLEANRADQAISPAMKLKRVWPEENKYQITTPEAVREASFISDAQYALWVESVPEDGPQQYLSNNGQEEYHEHRINLLKAIVCRVEALYQHWYDELRIGRLLSPHA
ncbi:MAG: DUF262 domain-containing protein [Candidatus Solibacter sp.]|nr:DUF262 domain-containing protein [Candidatus Solibacter sp.]